MKTRMWYIGLKWEINSPVVIVTDDPDKLHFHRLKVRSITARAAARVYIRNNLAWDLASSSYETTNMFSPDYMSMEQWMIQRHKKYTKGVTIRKI